MVSMSCLSLIYFLTLVGVVVSKSTPRIAIIGGGIGGSSCAHYMRKQFGNDADIVLFESSVLGGRLATVEIGNRLYESGGSIIHPENKYMVEFAKSLNLTARKEDGRFALYDGQKIVFDASSHDIVLLTQLLWHYSLDPVYLDFFIKDMLANFSRVYKHQEEQQAFTTVDGLLESMSPSFVNMLHQPFADYLTDLGYKKKFANELVAGAINTNYGQMIHTVHAFVGSVAIAGAQPGLWHVAGGNRLVAERLINTSSVTVVHDHVTLVNLLPRSNEEDSRVRYLLTTQKHPLADPHFEIVVIATPLESAASLAPIFVGFPSTVWQPQYDFEPIVATFVKGVVNHTMFGFTSASQWPDAVLVTTKNTFFNAIGKLRPIDDGEPTEGASSVYKVFTPEPLTAEQLKQLFLEHSEVKEVRWLAYPHYPVTVAQGTLQPFELFESLYYVNAIEIAASAMEMSVIGARNVALLAHHRWHGDTEHVVTAGRLSGARGHLQSASDEL